MSTQSQDKKSEEREAAVVPLHEDIPEDDAGRASLLREFIWFLRDNKRWWLIPLIIMFLLLGLLIFVSASPALAPFLYAFL